MSRSAVAALRTQRQATPRVETRRVADLRSNPLNPRRSMGDLAELTASIRASGILQPLLITPAGLVVAGHRRLAACKGAGVEEVPVLVRDLTESEQIAAMLSENLQRQGINPIEVATACKGLRDRGMEIEEIAAKIGIGVITVKKHLGALTLPQELQDRLADGSMPFAYVKFALEHNAARQRKLLVETARKAIKGQWSAVEFYTSLNRGGETPRQTAARERRREASRPQPSRRERKQDLLAAVRDFHLRPTIGLLKQFEEFEPYRELAQDLHDKLVEESESL